MKVECVHCGASGQIDETKIPPGVSSLKCPRCNERFPIPVSEGSADLPARQEAVQAVAQAVAREVAQEEPSPLATAQPPLRTAPSHSAPAEELTNCTVCASLYPKDEMARFGTSWVCAACKPTYVQMLAQGKTRPGEVRYAGFSIRFGAKFLDGLILGLISFLITFVLGFLMPEPSPESAIASGLIAFVLQTVLYAVYNGYFLSQNEATPGKMACGLKVVSPTGGRISFARGVGRYFAELLSSVTLGIGYLMVLFDAEKRSLHDRVCATRVVYK